MHAYLKEVMFPRDVGMHMAAAKLEKLEALVTHLHDAFIDLPDIEGRYSGLEMWVESVKGYCPSVLSENNYLFFTHVLSGEEEAPESVRREAADLDGIAAVNQRSRKQFKSLFEELILIATPLVEDINVLDQELEQKERNILHLAEDIVDTLDYPAYDF